MRHAKAILLVVTGLLVGVVAWPTVAAQLASSGTLRGTFISSNPVQARTNPTTGEVTGPAADLTRELARRLNVRFSIRGVEGVKGVIDSVKEGSADIGFVAYDPTRAQEVDFSQTYLLAHNTYVVRVDSPIHTASDVDKPGVRVGVAPLDAAGLYLRRTLQHAELRPNANTSMSEALRMMEASEVDAYAANTQRLVETFAGKPRYRVLPDSFLPVQQAIIVEKGNSAKLAIVNRFIDEARAAGLIQAAIDRAMLVGVSVAARTDR